MNAFKNLNKLRRLMPMFSFRILNYILSGWILLFSLPALSQEKQVKLTPVDSLLPMLGGLIVILIFIFGLAYLFKRFTNFSPSSKNIKILETQMIGTKEKLVIVRVQQQNFLIGVTPNSISQLGELNLNELAITENDSKDESIKQSKNKSGASPDFKSVLANIVRNSVGLKSSNHDVDKLVG